MATAFSRVLRNVPLPEPYLAGMAAGYGLHRLSPLPLPGAHSLRRAAGLSLVGTGSAIVVSSLIAVGRIDLQHPERLVTWGPYAISRNPMYVGWGLLHLGTALIIGSAWMAATLPPAAAWIHRQVLREERQLRDAFGEEFASRATVPRYLPHPHLAG
jgi:protein-S-isoprenylcysteine O-methyltransferase Ste14